MAVDGELSLPLSHAFSSGYAGNLAYAYIDRLSRQTAPAPSMDGAGAFVHCRAALPLPLQQAAEHGSQLAAGGGAGAAVGLADHAQALGQGGIA